MNVSVGDWALQAVFLALGFVLGPTFGYVSRSVSAENLSLAQVRDRAHRQAPRGVAPRRPRPAPSEGSDALGLWFVGAVVAVVLYLKYRTPVLLGLSFGAISIAIWTLVCLAVMSRRGIVSGGRGTSAVFLALLAAATTGLVNVWLLIDPPAGGPEFATFMTEYASSGSFSSLEGLSIVLYQLIGASAYVVVALCSIAFCVAVVSAVNLHTGSWGAAAWRWTFSRTSSFWGRGTTLFVALLTVLSVLLCGGWAYRWLMALAPSSLPS